MQPKLWVITGANGHFANTLIRQLVNEGENVVAFVLPNDRCKALKDLDVRIVEGDIKNRQDVNRLLDSCPLSPEEICVVHAAGIVSIDFKEKERIHEVNVLGTRNISQICKDRKIGRFVYISSVHAFCEPSSNEIIDESSDIDSKIVEGLYAKSKAEATLEVREMIREGLHGTIVFPSGMIGPYDYGCGHMTQLVLDYAAGRLRVCVDGGYDFADVRDVANGVIDIVRHCPPGEAYILSGEYISVKQILTVLETVFPKYPVYAQVPLKLAKAVAPLAEIYYRIRRQKPLYTRYSLYTLTSNASFSHAKATASIGYQPRKASESLIDMAQWLIEQNRVKKGS